MTDSITIVGAHLTCRLGITAEERAQAQPIVVDAELHLELGRAGASDRLQDTVDYAAVRQTLADVAGAREYALVETLAAQMAQAVLAGYAVEAVTLTVYKPEALRMFGVDNTKIRIHRRRG